MFASFCAPMLGIRATPAESIALASRHGFGGVDLHLHETRAGGPEELRARLAEAGLRAGVASGLLPVRLAAPQAEWDAALTDLPALAAWAQKAGFTRTTIVMLPFHETLAFDACFALCVARLRQAGQMLDDYGLVLGVEYVSQLTRRAGQAHVFLHDLAGALSLLDAAATPTVGLLLDSFHWHCAGESLTALRALPARRVVAVHLADAPRRPLAEQVASERELPGAGTADLRGFCAMLRAIGYDGPATCEPFRKEFETMSADDVARRVADALRAVMA